LSALIQDRGLRRKMGLQGIETVEKGYSLAVTSDKFLKVLEDLTRHI
jgi:hypothetical protein